MLISEYNVLEYFYFRSVSTVGTLTITDIATIMVTATTTTTTTIEDTTATITTIMGKNRLHIYIMKAVVQEESYA